MARGGAARLQIKWTKFDSGADINTAFVAEELDFGAIGSSPVARGLSAPLNIPYQVAFVLDVAGDNEALVARNGTGITNVAGLRGKRVAARRSPRPRTTAGRARGEGGCGVSPFPEITAPLTAHWFLPTNGDGRHLVGGGHGVATGSAGAIRPASIGYLAQIARAAEGLGFAGALTPTGARCEDTWLTTAMLVPQTERLKFRRLPDLGRAAGRGRRAGRPHPRAAPLSARPRAPVRHPAARHHPRHRRGRPGRRRSGCSTRWIRRDRGRAGGPGPQRVRGAAADARAARRVDGGPGGRAEPLGGRRPGARRRRTAWSAATTRSPTGSPSTTRSGSTSSSSRATRTSRRRSGSARASCRARPARVVAPPDGHGAETTLAPFVGVAR